MPLKGGPEMKKVLKAFKEGMPKEIAAAIYQEATAEATEVAKRTPVWNPARPIPRGTTSGALRASVKATKPVQEGKRIYCTIVAGGAEAAYAIIVHEDLEAVHATGQAKFLESVISESRSSMGARIAARIDFNRAAKG